MTVAEDTLARGHPVALASERGDETLPPVRVAFMPGPMTDLLTNAERGLRAEFLHQGCTVVEAPDTHTELVITTAPFGVATSWRDAVLFQLRRTHGIEHSPLVYTLVHARPSEFEEWMDHFEGALSGEKTDDFRFDGLAGTASRVIREQGERGGPILALERVVQGQTKSVRVVLFVGGETPSVAYHFDLVGAHPQSRGDLPAEIYRDIVRRMITTANTEEIADHEVSGALLPQNIWSALTTPESMARASSEMNDRGFFTDPVHISDLVKVPVVSSAIANHYSEGCFATWEPELDALVATVTGSVRPIHKGQVNRDDLAVIVAVRSNGMGALFRPIEGLPQTPPSSEAVELMGMDELLPRINLPSSWNIEGEVPALRSKLHGHRGISAYNPDQVEFVPLDPCYHDYLVSCASDAQAQGVQEAFARSEALRNMDDPRQIVFTILPGHGLLIAEKWVRDKDPFQVIWEAMDGGDLKVTSLVPQGRIESRLTESGAMLIEDASP